MKEEEMKVIKASYEILTAIDKATIYKQIETAARTCYKSEEQITEESAVKMIKGLVSRKHEAMLEHASITVKFIVDRGVSHEIVRHRLASYAQESTRYCSYNKDKFGHEITVIEPLFWEDQILDNNTRYMIWKESCEQAEKAYLELLEIGAKPEEARCVLPNSLKTEIVVTMNIREWRHFLNLRAANATGVAHPQIRQVAVPLLNELYSKLPELFFDIYDKLPLEEKYV